MTDMSLGGGNGRTGRLLMNQMLLNCGLLPAIITEHAKYRQAFRRYDRNKELDLMIYVLTEGILESYRILSEIRDKYLLDQDSKDIF